MHVKGVLVADYVAPVDHGMVCADSESHRLVLGRTRPVLKCHVSGYKTSSCG
ncbi:hypothetical protein OIU78_029309, partial [Salix suchowensis]